MHGRSGKPKQLPSVNISWSGGTRDSESDDPRQMGKQCLIREVEASFGRGRFRLLMAPIKFKTVCSPCPEQG